MSDVTYNEATLSWASEGDYVIVVAREGGSIGITPENGEFYTSNTVFGSGDDLGAGSFVIYTGTDETVSMTNLTEASEYYLAIYKYDQSTGCYNITSPATENFLTNGSCHASGGGDEYIDGVVLANISNLGTGSNNYQNFTNLTTDLEAGATITLSIVNGNMYDGDDLGVWIDFNDNESFDDAGENVICSVDDGANGDYNLSIPIDASLGNHTLRIRIKWSGSDCGDPCGVTDYGEVEDYIVNIICPSNDVTIETQPYDISVCEGGNGTFTIEATNASSYQWRKEGVSIDGETNDTLVISNVSNNDAADYSCIAIGPCNSLLSSSASLSIKPPTQITTQPADINANVGDDITFSVVADGENLVYQWKFEGTDIDGAMDDSHQILSVIQDDAGEYTVMVSGDCGDVTSETANLSVTTSIKELSEFGIKIYPNPSEGIFNVQYSNLDKAVEIIIYSLDGKVVYNEKHFSKTNVIDISDKVKGMYIVRFNFDDKSIVSNIILK